MLPDETEARAKLRELFEREFEQFNALQLFSVALIPFPLKIQAHRGLDRAVVDVALGLYVKACRQFRGIQLLSEAGLGSDASALTRGLFETTLALKFVLAPRFVPRRNGKRLPNVKGKPLTVRFRARMYAANLAFEKLRMLDRWRATHGLKRKGVMALDTKAIEDSAQHAEGVLGAEWTARLKSAKSYSGLNMRDLACSANFRTSYETFYRMTSWPTHAVDADAMFAAESILDIAPSPRGIPQAIGWASLLILQCCDLVNSQLRLGRDEEIRTWATRLGARQ